MCSGNASIVEVKNAEWHGVRARDEHADELGGPRQGERGPQQGGTQRELSPGVQYLGNNDPGAVVVCGGYDQIGDVLREDLHEHLRGKLAEIAHLGRRGMSSLRRM